MSLGECIVAVVSVLVAQSLLTKATYRDKVQVQRSTAPNAVDMEAREPMNDVIRTNVTLVPNKKMGRNYLANAVAEIEIMYYIPPSQWEQAGRNEQQVWQYFEMLTHAANVLYEPVVAPRVVLRMCGVRILKTRYEVSFLTDRDLMGDLNIDESLKVHKKFQAWVAGERKRGALSPCDVHALVVPNSCCGWANLNLLCWQPKTANDMNEAGNGFLVVDNIGTFRGTRTLAHEVAHLLGVDHDGLTDSSDCSSQEGHIMGSSYARFGIWSPCSTRKMRQFLSSTAGMCAFRRSCTRHYAPTKARISWYHNQGHDQQCQIHMDPFLQTPHKKYLLDGPESCGQLYCRTANYEYEPAPYLNRVPGGSCKPGSYCRFSDKQCVPGTYSPPDFSTVY